jgi:asparagine synthase (glutamine-hydrolysing)
MCGIFAYFKNASSPSVTGPGSESADSIRHRGPDETRKITVSTQNPEGELQLVFHRLAINGLTPAAGQPFISDDRVYLLANGEIYNYVELQQSLPPSKSDSDCEVILQLYLEFGIEKTINLLDGEFAFCIVDLRVNRIYVGRDHVGVRALYYLKAPGKFAVCSELKGLMGLTGTGTGNGNGKDETSGGYLPVDQFPNRHYGVYDMTTEQFIILPYETVFTRPLMTDKFSKIDHMHYIPHLLRRAVHKRLMCERTTNEGLPAVGSFLSGGLDSSLVAALAQDLLRERGPIHTFSIGFKDAPDLLAARDVARHIGSVHHEHVVTPDYMLSLLPEVIRQIESYDITSVRASAFMYALSKYIREQHPNIVVLLSGEGPDEASGSYMYFYNAPSHEEFSQETFRLLDDLRYFDCLRGDKATAGHSLEIRVPFLDQNFLHYYMLCVHPKYKIIPRKQDGTGGMEKYILRKSFELMTGSDNRLLLPNEIIWRLKEAMSDGVSNRDEGSSWFQLIQAHIRKLKDSARTIMHHAFKDAHVETGVELEREWYREVFNRYYPGCSHLVPYYWLPRWSYDTKGAPVQDPSARVLSVYRSGDLRSP